MTHEEIVKINKSTNAVVKRVRAAGLLAVRTNDNHVIALSGDDGLLIYDKDLNFIKKYQTIKNDVEHMRHIQVDNNYALFLKESPV